MSRPKDNKGEKKSTSKSKSEQPSKSAALIGNVPMDPTLSSLFANSLGPSKPVFTSLPVEKKREENDDDDDDDEVDNDEELSELEDEELDDEDDEEEDEDAATESGVQVDEDDDISDAEDAAENAADAVLETNNNRKRKRKDKQPELEDVYMEKLSREEEKAIAKEKKERSTKRQKTEKIEKAGSDEDSDNEENESASEEDDAATPPPVHESLLPDTTSDIAKSQRTVFLGNVSTEAISSKTALKTLMRHLASFFDQVAAPEKGQPAHKVESLRFRSTAYATPIPKKAAFAKKELMDATTKSTNAYAIYSSNMLAREATKRLNGSVVLDRHMRVDEVAHPAKVDNKRCVFVGNLGFVDDETNIDQANADEGKGRRHGNKTPSDVEEGLWRSFSTCGKVESVRVPRDSKTRVGKGFAYVQFTDENAVEAALLLNEKKFPPMLPRKLRVTRAKVFKRSTAPSAASTKAVNSKGIYNPKMTSEEQSQLGRASKLLGRAGAAQVRKGGISAAATGIRKPEDFIFEGHRAMAGQGKSGLKLGGSGGKKKGKPKTRSSNRASAWKAGGGGKKD